MYEVYLGMYVGMYVCMHVNLFLETVAQFYSLTSLCLNFVIFSCHLTGI